MRLECKLKGMAMATEQRTTHQRPTNNASVSVSIGFFRFLVLLWMAMPLVGVEQALIFWDFVILQILYTKNVQQKYFFS